MPRSKRFKKAMSTTEQIAALKEEIENLNAQIKEDKAMLKQLETELENEKKAELLKAVEASGKSYDEVMDMLKVLD